MKKSIVTLLLFSIIFSLVACSSLSVSEIDQRYSIITDSKLSKEAKIAQLFLQEKGYKVIAYSSGTSSSYQLTEEKLNDEQDKYENYKWALQGISPERYIGKTINNERFIVKNHPLDKWKSGSSVSEGKAYVDVMVIDGKALGGVSAPYTKEKLVGKPFTLDGETLEEIKNK